MSQPAIDPPEYVPPQPGEFDSLEGIFTMLEACIARLDEEAILHIEMYADEYFCEHLLQKLSWSRQGLQNIETAAAQRMTEVLG